MAILTLGSGEDFSGFSFSDNDVRKLEQNMSAIFNFTREEKTNQHFDILCGLFEWIISRVPLPTYPIMDFVVRARPNYYGEIFKEEWEISYNSRNIKVIEPGRFNRRFEPMFYAALKGNDHKGGNLPTASMESCKELLDPTNTNTTQMLTFGKWKVKEMFRVINLTYHEPTMRNNPQARNFLNLYFAEVEKELPKSTVDQIRKFIIFLSTITSTKDNNHSHYFISNAFWVTVREYYENFDGTKMYGIIYPSLMTEHNGINLVLTPEAVDTFLELTNVMMYTYERRKANMKEYWGYPVTNLAEVKDHRYSLLFTPPGL